MTLQMKAIDYREGDSELTGYLVLDDKMKESRPGVLVVHGGAGLDDHAKGRARQLASLGYVAFACDMYGKSVTAAGREKIMAYIMSLRDDRARLCARVQSGVEVLKAQPEVDGRVAAVGYCFGGRTVLELARSGADLAAVISLHGSLDTKRPAQAASSKAWILVCHGALDPHVPMAHVKDFCEEMNRVDANWQLNIYGGAMHGFTHEAGPPVPGVAYHAPADLRSSEAIRSFLAEAFGS